MFAAIYKIIFPAENSSEIQDRFFDAVFNMLQVEERRRPREIVAAIYYDSGVKAVEQVCEFLNIYYEKVG